MRSCIRFDTTGYLRLPSRATGLLQLLNEPRLSQLETKVSHHLPVLGDDLFGFGKHEGLEEVGKIFINLQLIDGHGEAPFKEELSWHNRCEDDDDDACHAHDEKW